MIDINPTIRMITLNVNGQNIPITTKIIRVDFPKILCIGEPL